MSQHIIVAGSSGLIGRAVVDLLAQRAELSTTALVRRAGSAGVHGAVRERVFAFAGSGDYGLLGTPALPCDVLLCCLGTTMRSAGSREAFREVDLTMPLRLARAVLGSRPNAMIGMISSVGAEAPAGFYLQTKAELETTLRQLAPNLVVARPSLLLGERAESRLGESLMQKLAPAVMRLAGLVPVVGQHLAKYQPVAATAVAAALVHACIEAPQPGQRLLVGADFRI